MKSFIFTFLFFIRFAALAETASFKGMKYNSDMPDKLWEIQSLPKLMKTMPDMPEVCVPLMREVYMLQWNFVNRAASYLRQGPIEEEAYQALEKLRSLLVETENENPRCFQPVSVFYALSSLTMMTTFNDMKNPILLLFSLNKEGKFKAMSRKDREEMGGLWNKPSSQNPNQSSIMGAYDCESSTIFFDPYLPPGDLAASVVHELSHLLRDKVTLSQLSLREGLLADEAFASLAAALLQINKRDWLLGSDDRELSDQVENFDFTLYSRKGEIRKMGPNKVFSTSRFYSLHRFLNVSERRPRSTKNLKTVFRKIQKMYFPESRVDHSKLYVRAMSQSQEFKDPLVLLNADSLQSEKSYDAPKMMQRILSSTRSVSPACRLFLEKTKSGELNDYLGSGLKTPMKPGSEGVKPGSEGVKPGTGVRLCISQRIRI